MPKNTYIQKILFCKNTSFFFQIIIRNISHRITYRINNNETFIEFGVVGKVYESENDISFENGSTFDMKLVIGTPEKVYKNIGSVLSIVNSKWGFLFIILVPCFLIFIYQIYELVIEIKFGKEEK